MSQCIKLRATPLALKAAQQYAQQHGDDASTQGDAHNEAESEPGVVDAEYEEVEDKDKEAKEMFEKAYNLYSLFWGINLGEIKLDDVSKLDDDKLTKKDAKGGVFAKLGAMVKKAIDCCIE